MNVTIILVVFIILFIISFIYKINVLRHILSNNMYDDRGEKRRFLLSWFILIYYIISFIVISLLVIYKINEFNRFLFYFSSMCILYYFIDIVMYILLSIYIKNFTQKKSIRKVILGLIYITFIIFLGIIYLCINNMINIKNLIDFYIKNLKYDIVKT